MGWQTTFTLARRSKGCYLVTNEILEHIQQGLNGVQVSVQCSLICFTRSACSNKTGRNALLNDVSDASRPKGQIQGLE